jgi:hypothetical protein
MNNLEFWRLIDESLSVPVKNEEPLETQYNSLLENLRKLSPEDIMKFYFIFQKKFSQAQDGDNLAPIFYVINGGMIAKDVYFEFIGWIISRGKEAYENILKNPDYICSILEYKPALPLFGPQYEIFNLVVPQAAVDAYTEKCDSNMNADYQALNYPQEFLDSLIDEKRESIIGLLDHSADNWSNPKNQEIIAQHFPLAYEKFGNWMRSLFGDFDLSTPESQETFRKLLKKEVQEMENDPNEPPVISRMVEMVSCSNCQKLIEKTVSKCPHCGEPNSS